MTITGYAFEVEKSDEVERIAPILRGLPISYLHITKDMKLEQSFYPNWWIRFWHKVLLGWKWEKVAYYDSH